MPVAISPASPEKYSVTGSRPVQLAIVSVGRVEAGDADVGSVAETLDGPVVVDADVVVVDRGRVVVGACRAACWDPPHPAIRSTAVDAMPNTAMRRTR